MIQINELSFQYPGALAPALNKLSLSIKKGDCVGLLGPNGAGKTTLISLLSGLQRVQSGEILFDKKPLSKLPVKEAQTISVVPQDFAFYPRLTVWENINFFAALYKAKKTTLLENVLERVDLQTYKKVLAKNLSGGLKRRLNFAIALVNSPRLIFMDEPTVGVDPQSREFILNNVKALADEGVTVIYTSHYLHEIEQIFSGSLQHGIAVLFIMPLIFILIMSFALSDTDSIDKSSKIAFVGSTSLSVNEDFAEQFNSTKDLSLTPFNLDKLNAVQSDLKNGAYDLIILNPNTDDHSLTDERPLELQVLASKDKAWVLHFKGITQKIYTEVRLKAYLASLPELELPKIDSRAPKKVRDEQEKTYAQIKASIPDINIVNDYLSSELVKEHYLTADGEESKQPSSVEQSVPAWLIFGMFFIMIPLSNVMADERNTNTILRLQMAKTSAASLLLAKLIPYFIINQIQFFGMIAVGIYILPLLGIDGFTLVAPLYNYLFLSVMISLAALGYGLLISVTAKSTEHAVVLGGGGNIIMAAIGGIMVPSYVMPDSMQVIAKISPMAWGLEGFHDLQLNQYDFMHLLPTGGGLLAFAGVFFLLTYISYSRALKGHA